MLYSPKSGLDKEEFNLKSRLTVVLACTFCVGLIVGVGEVFGGETDRESAGAQGCHNYGVEVHGGFGDADSYNVKFVVGDCFQGGSSGGEKSERFKRRGRRQKATSCRVDVAL